MTYLGYKISEPSLILVEDCIRRHNYALDANTVFKYFQRTGWKNKEGKPIASLETAVAGMLGANRPRKQRPLEDAPRRKSTKRAPRCKPEVATAHKRIPYAEQLKDRRWLAFRAKALARAQHRCSRCGSQTGLQVHHPFYKPNKYAWEYNVRDVIVLCRSCHEKAHGIDLDKQLDAILQNA